MTLATHDEGVSTVGTEIKRASLLRLKAGKLPLSVAATNSDTVLERKTTCFPSISYYTGTPRPLLLVVVLLFMWFLLALYRT